MIHFLKSHGAKYGAVGMILVIAYLYLLNIKPDSSISAVNSSVVLLNLIFGIAAVNLYKSIINGLLFQGITWSFWIVFLCIAPIVQIKINMFPLRSDNSFEQNQTGVLVIFIATICLWLGSLIVQRNQPKDIHDWKIRLNSNGIRVHSYMRSIALLSMLTFLIIVSRTSFSVFLLTRYQFDEMTRNAFPSTQIALILVSLCKISSTMYSCYSLLNRYPGQFNNYRGILKILVVLQTIYVNNPISSSRLSFVAMVIALALSGARLNSFFIRYFILSIVPFYLLLFPTLDKFRYTTGSNKKTGLYDALTNPDFDAYQQLSNTVSFVNENGFSLGKQISGAFLLYIPNEFWQSKPSPSGPLVAGSLNLRFTNVSSPVPAEAYIDFGIIGVVIYSLLLGYLVCRADKYIIRCVHDQVFNSVALISLIAFSGQISLLLRGALIGVSGPSILIFLLYFFRKFFKSRENT